LEGDGNVSEEYADSIFRAEVTSTCSLHEVDILKIEATYSSETLVPINQIFKIAFSVKWDLYKEIMDFS
jgi:hypothetical protein